MDSRQTGLCSFCGRTMRLSCLDPRACSGCYIKLVRPNRKQCSVCERATIKTFGPDNAPLCKRCRLDGSCDICGRSGLGLSINKGQVVCRKCYTGHIQPRIACSMCGRIDICQARINNAPVCPHCYRNVWVPADCSVCGASESTVTTVDGLRLCKKCRNAQMKLKSCSHCGKESKLYYRGGTVCAQCYNLALQPKHVCSSCGKSKTSLSKTENGHLCRRCWNLLPERKAKNFSDKQKYRSADTPLLPVHEWARMMKVANWKCFYCSAYIGGNCGNRTVDHVVPVSKGGLTVPSNLVPCCRSCNSSKGDKDVVPWLRTSGKVENMTAEKLIRLGIMGVSK